MSYKEHKMKRIPRDKLNQIPFIKKINVNLKSLKDINYISGLQILNISGNPLRSFDDLPDLPTLHTLIANDTQISSLKGAILLPALQELSLLNTPLSTEENFEIMCLSAFGPTIRNLNDCLVSKKNKNISNNIRSKVYPFLFKGYVLDSIEPLVVSLPNKLPRTKIKIDLEPSDSQEKEEQIKNNENKIKELKAKIQKLQKKRNALSREVEDKVLKNYTTPIHFRKKKSPAKNIQNNTLNSSQNQNESKSQTDELEQNKQNDFSTQNKDETNNNENEDNAADNYENKFVSKNDDSQNVNEDEINSQDQVENNINENENNIIENENNIIENENNIIENENNDENQNDNHNDDYLNQFMDEDQNENNGIAETKENAGNDENLQTINDEEIKPNEEPEQNIEQNENEHQDDDELLNQILNEDGNNDSHEEPEQNNENANISNENDNIENQYNDENQNENQNDNHNDDYLNQFIDENQNENNGITETKENTGNDENLQTINDEEIKPNEEPAQNIEQNENEHQDDDALLNQILNEDGNNDSHVEPEQNNENANISNENDNITNSLDIDDLLNDNQENAAENNNENFDLNNSADIDNLLLEDENQAETGKDQAEAGKVMSKPPVPPNSKNSSSYHWNAIRPPQPSGNRMMSSASIDQELNAIKAINPPENDNSGFIKPEGNDYDNLSEIAQGQNLFDDKSIDDILNGADVTNDDN